MQQEEFNPFDLSAVPKPKATPEGDTQPPAPQPTVSRVSMGPLFHSRITRTLALILSLILAALIGYVATNYYYNQQAQESLTVIYEDRSTFTQLG